MKWLLAVIRIVGSSFPAASSLVQLQAEIDSSHVNQRLDRLEDPISTLHPQVAEVSRLIYNKMTENNDSYLQFDEVFYRKYAKPLACMEACHLIKGLHTIDERFSCGISINSPSYILYMCALFESETKMESLVEIVENAEPGQWINGDKLCQDLHLPAPVVSAIFDIFEDKGYGFKSKEIGALLYMAKV